jgi:hypothetical protein
MRRFYLAATVAGILIAAGLPASARKWTSSDGQQSVEAEMIDFADGKVKLKKTDGRTVTVPVKSLSEADRRYLATAKKKLSAAGASSVSYSRDVQPFLRTYCAGCHNASKAKAGYAVDTFTALTRAGKKGALVVPGKPAESELVLTLEGSGKHMPPRKSPQPSAEVIAKVTAWIEAGAEDDSAQQGQHASRGKRGKSRS